MGMNKTMVILKCSRFLSRQIGFVAEIDLSVRQYEEQPRIIYIGQSSQVIQIAEENLDEFIEFLKEAKNLQLTLKSEGWLK
jgi:hypothetical protein